VDEFISDVKAELSTTAQRKPYKPKTQPHCQDVLGMRVEGTMTVNGPWGCPFCEGIFDSRTQILVHYKKLMKAPNLRLDICPGPERPAGVVDTPSDHPEFKDCYVIEAGKKLDYEKARVFLLCRACFKVTAMKTGPSEKQVRESLRDGQALKSYMGHCDSSCVAGIHYLVYFGVGLWLERPRSHGLLMDSKGGAPAVLLLQRAYLPKMKKRKMAAWEEITEEANLSAARQSKAVRVFCLASSLPGDPPVELFSAELKSPEDLLAHPFKSRAELRDQDEVKVLFEYHLHSKQLAGPRCPACHTNLDSKQIPNYCIYATEPGPTSISGQLDVTRKGNWILCNSCQCRFNPRKLAKSIPATVLSFVMCASCV